MGQEVQKDQALPIPVFLNGETAPAFVNTTADAGQASRSYNAFCINRI
jgi:hypothetical protein